MPKKDSEEKKSTEWDREGGLWPCRPVGIGSEGWECTGACHRGLLLLALCKPRPPHLQHGEKDVGLAGLVRVRVDSVGQGFVS